jgi:predicted nucleic acid-binding protein
MIPYVDSGVLVALYVLEERSPDAAQAVARFRSLRINPLQELEVRNALHSLVGRGSITHEQCHASEQTIDRDIAAGRLKRRVPDWSEVFAIATNLSHAYAEETPATPVEFVHVAAAIVEGAALFITADSRQAALAEKVSLETELIG